MAEKFYIGPNDSHGWEYNILQVNVDGFFGPHVDPRDFIAELNRFGDAGWELVNTVDINRGNGRTSELMFIFKRQKLS